MKEWIQATKVWRAMWRNGEVKDEIWDGGKESERKRKEPHPVILKNKCKTCSCASNLQFISEHQSFMESQMLNWRDAFLLKSVIFYTVWKEWPCRRYEKEKKKLKRSDIFHSCSIFPHSDVSHSVVFHSCLMSWPETDSHHFTSSFMSWEWHRLYIHSHSQWSVRHFILQLFKKVAMWRKT